MSDLIDALESGTVEKDKIEAAANLVAGRKFIPLPGPQTDAWFSKADILLYGGSGGSGKSALILGLALVEHERSLIMRRRYADLSALIDVLIKFNGTRKGFTGSPQPKLRTDNKLIEFGACQHPGDEQAWQGRPHDLIGIDEATQFQEQQIRFLMGWMRTTTPGQRCRMVLATNPPLSSEGDWVIDMFAPWLDPNHENPAKPGELRWFITDGKGNDVEVSGPEKVEIDGKDYWPMSRTFIPGKVDDNPFLANTDYKRTLDNMQEPFRSAIRDGNFMLFRQDGERQLFPSEWLRAAQDRWTPNPPHGVPMCAIGVDPAQGGADRTVLSPRYDGWFAPLVVVDGVDTPGGKEVAALVVQNRKDGALVTVDMGGGFGGATAEWLMDNGVEVLKYKGAAASSKRSSDRVHGFVNLRSEAYWMFREALDPDIDGGSPIMLPDDPGLIAELKAHQFEMGARGIKVLDKEKVKEKLGRSPDKADAVIMSWYGGQKRANAHKVWHKQNSRPQVILGHEAKRRRR